MARGPLEVLEWFIKPFGERGRAERAAPPDPVKNAGFKTRRTFAFAPDAPNSGKKEPALPPDPMQSAHDIVIG